MIDETHVFDGEEIVASEVPQLLNQNFSAVYSNLGVWEPGEIMTEGEMRLLSGRENTGYILECVQGGTTGEAQPAIVETNFEEVANYADRGIVGRMRFIFNPAEKDIDELFALGQVYNRQSYAELWNYVQNRAGLLITEDEWQAKFVETNGKFVPYYSSGDDEYTFRLPLLGGYMKGAETSTEICTFKEAGLPNIKGSLGNGGGDTMGIFYKSTQTGAFSNYGTAKAYYPASNTTTATNDRYYRVDFNASKSNAIYGNSDTVVPETMVGVWVIKAIGIVLGDPTTDLETIIQGMETTQDRVANIESGYLPRSGGVMTGGVEWVNGGYATLVDDTVDNYKYYAIASAPWGEGSRLHLYTTDSINDSGAFSITATDTDGSEKTLTGSINGLSWDNQNITFVKESYTSGTTWYRVWSDGWIEQGGYESSNTSGVVTFPKAFSDTNYSIQPVFQCLNSQQLYERTVFVSAKTTTQATLRQGYYNNSNVALSLASYPVVWYACGY